MLKIRKMPSEEGKMPGGTGRNKKEG